MVGWTVLEAGTAGTTVMLLREPRIPAADTVTLVRYVWQRFYSISLKFFNFYFSKHSGFTLLF